MNAAEALAVMEEKGAVLRGHFRLTSGRHSDLFAQKFRVLEHPGIAQRFGEELAKLYAGRFDVVACPAVGALVLGFATALAAGVRMIFAERVEGAMTFRRGFHLAPHERVLVVEDVVTTGGSAREVVDLVRASGAEPIGIAALIDRVDPARPASLGAPLKSLVELEARSWPPESCPLCEQRVLLEEPGSRHLS